MSDVTVEQFAEVLKVTVDKLLAQLEEAGITSLGPKDRISEDAKHELLTHLRKAHGKAEDGGAPRKITLRRKAQSEIKVAAPMGKARMVSVEVRRQRTYIKRDVLEEQARVAQEVVDRQREAENAEQVAAEQNAASRSGRERAAAARAGGKRAPHRRRDYPPPGRGAGASRGRAEGTRAGREGASRSARKRRARRPRTTRTPATGARNCTSPAACRRVTRRAARGRIRAGAPQAVSTDRKHGFELPTQPVAARSRGRRDHHGRRAGAAHGRQVERSHEDHDQHGRHGDHQPAGGPGHGGARDRGNGPRRQGPEGRPGRGGAAGRHASV